TAIRDLPGDLREQPALFGAREPRANPLHGLTHISIMLYIAIVRYALSITLFILAGATAYEVLVALEVISLGSLPGEGPPGEQTIALIAVLAILVTAGLALVAALGARFYTFDPYYLPTLRRFSDDGMLPPVLVYGVLALAVGAALLTRANRRVGAALSVPVILACALFAQVLVGGH